MPVEKSVLWTADEIASAVHGQWVTHLPHGLSVTGVCYYPGQVVPGDVAFTVNPETWGRSYQQFVVPLSKYADVGAAFVIVDKENLGAEPPANLPILLVENTRIALDKLGIAARNRCTGKIICVTGSAGKSTTKEGLHHVLSKQGKVSRSLKNFNHGPGVPLSLAQTLPNIDYGIYEFAVDSPKVTLPKAKIARPHVAIVTNIYPDHLAFYSSIEAVADQKSLLFDALEPDGVAVLNRDDPLFDRLNNNAKQKGVKNILTFGEAKEADIRLIKYVLHQTSSDITVNVNGKEYEYVMGLPGKHMVFNSLSVLAGVHAVGANIESAMQELSSLQPLPSHLNYHKINIPGGFFQMIDDTYNANVASVRAALEYLSLVNIESGGRRLAVLGELAELGDSSIKIHQALATDVINAGIDKVFTVGEGMKFLREMLPKEKLGLHAKIGTELIDALKNEVRAGDTILLTGTRTHSLVVKEHLIHIVTALKSMHVDSYKREEMPLNNNRIVNLESKKKGVDKIISSIVFVGDTSFGENYQQVIKNKGGENLLDEKGYDYPLEKMKKLLCDADLVIANLETPLTNLKQSPFVGKKKYIHWSDTEKAPETLSKYNICALSLANNHTFDYGREGFQQTLSVLEKCNIPYFGAGNNINDASEPLIVNVDTGSKKITFAVIGAFEQIETYRKEYNVYAHEDVGGVYSLNVASIAKSVAALKKKYPDAYIILYPHWGKNYEQKSNGEQKQIAESLYATGVNLIIGHGAHLMQEIAMTNNRWIAYGLGNFMFNSPGRYAQMQSPPFSMVAKLVVEDNGSTLKLRFYPIVTDNKVTDYQSRFVNEKEFEQVCKLLETEKNSRIVKSQDEYSYFLEVLLKENFDTNTSIIDYCSDKVLQQTSNQLPGIRSGSMDELKSVSSPNEAPIVNLLTPKGKFGPSDALQIAFHGALHLARIIDSRGRFAYEIDYVKEEVVSSYNIIRHCGCVWSMFDVYDDTHDIRIFEAAKRALDYLHKRMQVFGDTLMVVEGGSCKAGGNALAALAFCKHYMLTGDEKSLTTARKLLDYLLANIAEDGELLFQSRDLEKPFVANGKTVIYFPGEVALALALFSAITREVRYADGARQLVSWLGLHRDREKQEQDHWLLQAFEILGIDYYGYASRVAYEMMNNPGYLKRDNSTPVACRSEALISYFIMTGDPQVEQFILQLLEYQSDFQLKSGKYHGAFLGRRKDPILRNDYTQHNISSFTRYWRAKKRMIPGLQLNNALQKHNVEVVASR